jgi:hypothetical protein
MNSKSIEKTMRTPTTIWTKINYFIVLEKKNPGFDTGIYRSA